MRALVLCLLVLLTSACATTATDRSALWGVGSVLDVTTGVLSLISGDPVGAVVGFTNAGFSMGNAVYECRGGACDFQDVESSPPAESAR